jgi:hypothetical protein
MNEHVSRGGYEKGNVLLNLETITIASICGHNYRIAHIYCHAHTRRTDSLIFPRETRPKYSETGIQSLLNETPGRGCCVTHALNSGCTETLITHLGLRCKLQAAGYRLQPASDLTSERRRL